MQGIQPLRIINSIKELLVDFFFIYLSLSNQPKQNTYIHWNSNFYKFK